MLCDLHTHSVFSDGTCTPEEVIDGAIAAGLSAVALTDHNTVDGLPDFLEAARGKNINIVPGLEFSADYKGTELHILGLFIAPEHFGRVAELMENGAALKEESNIALIEALRRDGYDLNYDEIKASTANGRVNRLHVAVALMQKGYVSTAKEAFASLLSKSGGYYVAPKRPSAQEIIDFISSIGAVSVLAHPFLNLDDGEIVEFLSITRGLDGMECYYSTYDEATTKRALELAEQFSLLPSGGSDFHGRAKPDINLGVGKGNLQIPYDWYLALKEKARN